ncbi:aldo/keto reductase [Sphingomonas sp.]|uniref:aldo/keto reductase n=1 Tax=Sphingomonas sp. TaxID=28214 RepID=UPI00286B8236|nr:aldo/keto reductase [Sphingomonas sp.]
MTDLTPPSARRKLGGSDIEVSALAWGHWRLAPGDVAANARLAHAALDTGIDFFDTADIYGFDGKGGFGTVEQAFGELLASEPGLRNRIVIATKGGIDPPKPYDSSPAYLDAAIDASLRRLGIDTIDLWQVHRPDILTHPHDIARTVERAHAAGRIRAFGVSNFTHAQIAALAACSTVPLLSTQPELSALRLDPFTNGESDQAMTLDLAILAWSPLAGGQLASPTDARATAVCKALDTVASEQGVSRTAAALSWLMAHPSRPIPIVGSQRPDRITESADALRVRWTRTNWYAVLVAARQEPLP